MMSYLEQMLAELGDDSFLKIRYDWVNGKGNVYSGFVYCAGPMEILSGPQDASLEEVMRMMEDLAVEWLSEQP